MLVIRTTTRVARHAFSVINCVLLVQAQEALPAIPVPVASTSSKILRPVCRLVLTTQLTITSMVILVNSAMPSVPHVPEQVTPSALLVLPISMQSRAPLRPVLLLVQTTLLIST